MSRFFALLSLFFLAVSLVLTVRTKLWKGFLGGFAVQFRLHHIFGLGCVMAIVLHVALEVLSVPSYQLGEYISLSDPGMASGWLALGCFLVGTGLAYIASWRFVIWRRWHMLLVLGFALAIVHVILFMSSSWLDRSLIGIFSILGLASLGSLAMRWRGSSSTQTFRLLKKEQLSASIYALELLPAANRPRASGYKAGQIVYVRFLQKGFSSSFHPFSVASCQFEPTLRLLIKGLGHDTSRVPKLQDGAYLLVAGPYDEFSIGSDIDQIWIAGGIGIAPFLGSMHCLQYKTFSKVRLIHFVGEEDNQALHAEIASLGQAMEGFSWTSYKVKATEKPEMAQIVNWARDMKNPKFLVCGPPRFMQFIRQKLQSFGFSRHNIITEEMRP